MVPKAQDKHDSYIHKAGCTPVLPIPWAWLWREVGTQGRELEGKSQGHARDMGPDTRLPRTCSRTVPSTVGREPGPQPRPGSWAWSAACQAPPATRLEAMGPGMLHGSLWETRGLKCWQGKATPVCFSQEHGVYFRRLPIAQASGKPLTSVQNHPNSGKLLAMPSFSRADFPL